MYTRINKRKALKEINSGNLVIITPNKCNPVSMFAYPIQSEEKMDMATFDNWLNHFEYYNCNSICGDHVNYYLAS